MTAKYRLLVVLVSLALCLIACSPASDTAPLPTLASNNLSIGTSVADVPTQVVSTLVRPTLPPTFTPTAIPPTSTPLPTNTPNAQNAPMVLAGTIYYIYNGDSIIALSPDGITNTLVMTFGVDKPITDLSASADGTLLTFVAPGNGLAREVYIMNRDGSYLQQISCLDFQDVRQPIFTPDGSAMVWFAAPEVGASGNIYRATVDGSNACPSQNQQALFVRTENAQFNGMTWNRQGDTLFYVTTGNLLQFDPVTQASTVAFGQSGITPNQNPTHNPVGDELIVLYATSQREGVANTIAQLLINTVKGQVPSAVDMDLMEGIIGVEWSMDGAYLAVTTSDTVYLRHSDTGKIDIIATDVSNPIAIISPDNLAIAYVRVDRRGTPQWHIYLRESETDTRITSNVEGAISDALWLP
jgi:hypothetical protein